MNNFSELSVRSALRGNLLKHGFVQPTEVQARSLPAALAGRDVIVAAQTGTGKTLAFVVPLIERLQSSRDLRGIQALVLSPTRELAIQIEETFTMLAAGTGMRAAVVVGGMSEERQLRAIRAGAQVVIATPGRLNDFLNRNLVNLGAVRIFVLDEADRMLDMGFLPSIRVISKALPAAHQTLFFSATIEPSVAQLMESHVQNPVRISVGMIAKPVELVDLLHYEVEQEGKLGLLLRLLGREQGSFLVFARTKRGADRLARKLAAAGVKAGCIHGDRTQNQRNHALAAFKTGHYRALVATDVAARGIHVDGIAHVVNYDLPQAPEDFIHRVGRTGRSGARGIASTFSTRAERAEIRNIERVLSVRFTRRETGGDLPREPQPATKVIVMPPHARERTAPKFASRHRKIAGK